MCKIFVQVKANRGRRRKFGKLPRVLLSGATVDVATKRLREKWTKVTGSAGLTEDQVYAHGKQTGFRPKKRK